MGREGFDPTRVANADIILVDESHNFRNDKSNRYLALDAAIQMNGGRGIGGERKKLILLSATPINNDVYDLQSQLGLFTQGEPDYFRAAGIGDLPAYFRRARKLAKNPDTSAGVVLFNLLEEIIVRNTRPYIRAAFPDATINGKRVAFPSRSLHTITYDLGATYGEVYDEIVAAIEQLSLAPYKLEAYRKKTAIRDEQEHEWETGREYALIGIFKTRYLKRLESSIEAFRLSLKRALIFEETYLDFLLDGTVVSSQDYHKAMRFLARDQEDELGAESAFERLEAAEEAKAHIEGLPKVDLNDYEIRQLTRDVRSDVELLRALFERTAELAENDGKLARLKELLAGELKGQKVLVFTSFMDTSRYVHAGLTGEDRKKWRGSAGDPVIRRIDSGNSPSERTGILKHFAPVANDSDVSEDHQIDILISTDVLSEGQNLQDCGVVINYDLTWNPIRLVQRDGRIDRLKSPHSKVRIYNMFPEEELEQLLHLVERLATRISVIDDLGLLDASVLGEIVHPRTFNVLRRIRAEDGAVLDEEEARAELAGPEILLRQLKELLNREGAEAIADLPHGIHSGLRRDKCYGMFFYFQAPRPDGHGKRHFWRYIDAKSHEVLDNRLEVAQLISCHPDEPRYIGDQDVFALQEKVIEHILAADMQAEARAAVPKAVHPIQRTIAEELKDSIRRNTVDREIAKRCVAFLGQPVGKAVVKRFTAAYDGWEASRDDAVFLSEIASLEEQFGKERRAGRTAETISREDLELICFEYVSS
ncbi:MAG: helicase-related protein [Planctomycetota bacterium]|jgi:superfamily II DNA or RNA helicase